MKILTIGYYDDFAHFFLALKKEFKKTDNNIEFYYFSLYISGFFYFFFRFQKVSFFSLYVWYNTILKKGYYKKILQKNSSIYKGVDLNKVISYHSFLDPSKKEKYKLQALSYIDIVQDFLKNNSFDFIFLSGDTRMCVEIFDFFAKKKQIPTFYFEQGPFGTTIWDKKGVNANASFRGSKLNLSNKSPKALKEQNDSFLKRNKGIKYKRNPLYRGADYIFQFLTMRLHLFPIDIAIDKNPKQVKGNYENLKADKPKRNTFLLILQVPFDVNMTHHSPFYDNHFSIVKNVYENLPKNYTLIVREHPLYRKRYESELYDYMFENNIVIDKEDLYQSIDSSDVVIVNNSSVGVEAISRYKRVVTLGNSYYDSSGLNIKLHKKEDLKRTLRDSLDFKINNENVIGFMNVFLFEFLIKGHYRDYDLKTTVQTVKERVLRNNL